MRPGQGLILITIALLGIGVVMISSAAATIGADAAIELPEVLLGRTSLIGLLAVAALLIGSALPVARVARLPLPAAPAPWILAAALALLVLVHVPGIGREVNGARRWISLGPVGFQPSEVAKWALPLALAWYATWQARSMGRLVMGFLVPIVPVGAVCALIASEDLGTAVLVGVVAIAVLVAGGTRVIHALILAPAGTAAFVAAVLASPYRLERLKAFLDPYADAQGIGYHMIQSMAAVSGGGLTGRGLGNSIQKFGYLPEDTTDFIFAIIAEELGIFGATAVVGLYAALILLGLRIVHTAREPFARLLPLGVVLTVGLQALINLAVVTGCGPTKGIALPLVSAGGTGWVLTAFAIGLVVAMDREGPGEACALEQS
jgi:cell division protein FtsW